MDQRVTTIGRERIADVDLPAASFVNTCHTASQAASSDQPAASGTILIENSLPVQRSETA